MPYYMSKLMIEMPVLILTPIVMLTITYWIIGFKNTAQSYFMAYFALFMLVQCASAIGMTVSSFAPNLVVATTIAPAFVLPMVLFGGLLVNTSTVFSWLAWIQWISPVRYCLNCFAIA